MLVNEKIYKKIISKVGQIAVLIDPDKSNSENYLADLIKKANFAKVDYFFIGGSSVSKKDFQFTLNFLEKHTAIPLVIFPGGNHQISEKADAILYLSLLSGRNPDFLIGQHVESAMELHKMDLEIIPTAYVLIDGGKTSAVAYISQTTPIPRDKVSIARNTALAGFLQGKKVVFFDAGSGANFNVPIEIIQEMRELEVPTIVGGGIKNIETIEKYRENGANVIVLGNYIEQNLDFLIDVKEFLLSNSK